MSNVERSLKSANSESNLSLTSKSKVKERMSIATINEDIEELNNVDSLKEILIHISQEYEECKEKCSMLMNHSTEKEKIIQELLECLTAKDDEHKREVLLLNEEIKCLNEKLNCNESMSGGRYNTSNSITNFDDEITELRLELSKKEIETQNLKMCYEGKLKENEEKYQTYINDLRDELHRVQETLNNKAEFGTFLNKQISEIDESREVLERTNDKLKTQIRSLEDLRKNEKNDFEKEKTKLNEEIVILKNILDEKNSILKDYDDVNSRLSKYLKENTTLKFQLATKTDHNEKLNSTMKELNKDIGMKEYENKILLQEIEEIKTEYANNISFHKDANIKLLEEIKNEKIRLTRIFEEEKNKLVEEIEKLRGILDNFNKEITNSKIEIESNSCDQPTFPKINIPKLSFLKFNTFECVSNKVHLDSDTNFEKQFKSKMTYETRNSLTLRECLSESEEEDENEIKKSNLEREISETKNRLNIMMKELEEKNKQNDELRKNADELNKAQEELLSQIFELKSILANERFDRENETTQYRITLKKLKEHIQKKDLALALKSLSSVN